MTPKIMLTMVSYIRPMAMPAIMPPAMRRKVKPIRL